MIFKVKPDPKHASSGLPREFLFVILDFFRSPLFQFLLGSISPSLAISPMFLFISLLGFFGSLEERVIIWQSKFVLTGAGTYGKQER